MAGSYWYGRPQGFLRDVWFSGYPVNDKGYPFFCGYPVFGLEDGGDMDNHFKMVVEHIPQKELDELNHFWIAPPKYFPICRF